MVLPVRVFTKICMALLQIYLYGTKLTRFSCGVCYYVVAASLASIFLVKTHPEADTILQMAESHEKRTINGAATAQDNSQGSRPKTLSTIFVGTQPQAAQTYSLYACVASAKGKGERERGRGGGGGGRGGTKHTRKEEGD